MGAIFAQSASDIEIEGGEGKEEKGFKGKSSWSGEPREGDVPRGWPEGAPT